MTKRRLHPSSLSPHPSAFTLIELLVVVGIIALLASILLPVISKVKESAREASTRALIQSIESACQAYKTTFSAYPGPLSNAYVDAMDQSQFPVVPTNWRAGDTGIGLAASGGQPANPNAFNDGRVEDDGTVGDSPRVTAAENLVLGLLGGVSLNKQNAGNYFLEFDPAAVGAGASILNPVRPGKSGTFMQSSSLSQGRFYDDNGVDPATNGFIRSRDTVIPEFVDTFGQPMPILVLRARTGARAESQSTLAQYKEDNNDVVVNLPSSNPKWVNGQYNLVDITPYTQSEIGQPTNLKQSAYLPSYTAKMPQGDPAKKQGLTNVDTTMGMYKSVAGETIVYPYNAFAYLADPGSYDTTKTVATQKNKLKARKQDTIILISAGRDRVYGTDDDVTNFGSVK